MTAAPAPADPLAAAFMPNPAKIADAMRRLAAY